MDLNGRMEATLRGVSVILYIEDVDLNPAPHLRFPDNPVILYIEDVDLNRRDSRLYDYHKSHPLH